jgi:uncharacterized protein YraI
LLRNLKRFSTTIAAIVLLVIATAMIDAQSESSIKGVINEKIGMFAGPGQTYEPLADLQAGDAVDVRGRTEAGNWLYIILPGATTREGWTLTGYITLPEGTQFSQVPVIRSYADADVERVVDPLLKELYAVPILPEVDEEVCTLYKGAVAAARAPYVISKVGDSNSAAVGYLTPIGEGKVELGPYDYLQNTVDAFGPSMAITSAATRVGMNSSAVFDPMWSDREVCNAGETPLSCEYSRTNPAIAVIMFGANDVKILNSEGYEAQLRRVIETTLEANILPLVISFTANPQTDNYYQALVFNQIALHLAQEYDVPFINFWSAGRNLLHGGVGEDDVHLTNPGASFRLGSNESRYGVTLHNLMVLNTLDQLIETCDVESPVVTPQLTPES